MQSRASEVNEMQIDFTSEELQILRTALDRAVSASEKELVRTDAPRLQHEIARDYDRLRALRDRLSVARPSLMDDFHDDRLSL